MIDWAISARCGMLTHTERFCQKKFSSQEELAEKECGAWLIAPPRRAAGKSKWLRDDGDEIWGDRYGTEFKNEQIPHNLVHGKATEGNYGRNDRDILTERAKNKANNTP